MKRRDVWYQKGELAIGSLIVIGLMVLGSVMAVGSQELLKQFRGDTGSRASCTQCGGGQCPDGWSYPGDDCWLGGPGTCGQRHNEACGGHQGGGGGGGSQPQPTQAPNTGGGGCQSGWTCNGHCASAGDVSSFNSVWCDGRSRWMQEAGCGGAGSAPRSSGCGAVVATQPPTTGGTGGTGGSTSCASGWQCGTHCASARDVTDFNSVWCDGRTQWMKEAGCGGAGSTAKSAGCGGTTSGGTGGSTGGGGAVTSCSVGIISFGGCCGVGKRYAYTREANCYTRDVCEDEKLHAGTSLCTNPTAIVTARPVIPAVTGVPAGPTATPAPAGTTCSEGYLSAGIGCCATGKSWRVWRFSNCSTENRCNLDNTNCNNIAPAPTTVASAGSLKCPQPGSDIGCDGKNWGEVCASPSFTPQTGAIGRCGISGSRPGVCSCLETPGTATVVPTGTITTSGSAGGSTTTTAKKNDWESCQSSSQCASGRCERDRSGDNSLQCIPVAYVIKKPDGEICPNGLGSECISGICAKDVNQVNAAFRCQSSSAVNLPTCEDFRVVSGSPAFSQQCKQQVTATAVAIGRQCIGGYSRNSAGTLCSPACTADGSALTNASGGGICCSGNKYSEGGLTFCGLRPYCDRSLCLNGCSRTTTSGGVCIASGCNAACNDNTGCGAGGSCQSVGFGGKTCVCQNQAAVATPPPSAAVLGSRCGALTTLPANTYCCFSAGDGVVKRSGEPCVTPAPIRISTTTPAPTFTALAPQATISVTTPSPTRSAGGVSTPTPSSSVSPTYQGPTQPTQSVAVTARPTISGTPPNTGARCETWNLLCRIGMVTPRPTATTAPAVIVFDIPNYTPPANFGLQPVPNTTVTPSPLPQACSPKTTTFNYCCGTGRRINVELVIAQDCSARQISGDCVDLPDGDDSCGPREQYNVNVSTVTSGSAVTCPEGYAYDERPPFGWSNCQPIRCDEGYRYDNLLKSCIPMRTQMSEEERTCDFWGSKVRPGITICDGNTRLRCVNPARGEEDQWDRVTCTNGCQNGICNP